MGECNPSLEGERGKGEKGEAEERDEEGRIHKIETQKRQKVREEDLKSTSA
jgi:hypothetical protein